MTIQDSSVLDGGDDDGVLLEDQNLQSVFRQKIIQKQKLALANLTSRKFLPNEEEDDWGEGGILSKYDDIAKTAKQNKKQVVIGQENLPN